MLELPDTRYRDFQCSDIESCLHYDSISRHSVTRDSRSRPDLISGHSISGILDIRISSLTQYPESGNRGTTVVKLKKTMLAKNCDYVLVNLTPTIFCVFLCLWACAFARAFCEQWISRIKERKGTSEKSTIKNANIKTEAVCVGRGTFGPRVE